MKVDRKNIRREDRIRKNLRRMGYQLVKNRGRDPNVYNYGGYMIVDPYTNFVVTGASPFSFSLTLDDVESFARD